MKQKFLLALASVAVSAVTVLSFMAPPPPPDDADQLSFERFPPIPRACWVQQLATPVDTFNMILRIQFESDDPLPDTLKYFADAGNQKVIFHDDGIAPGLTVHDGVYAAYLSTDIPKFLEDVAKKEEQIAYEGRVSWFKGHVGQELEAEKVPAFETGKFSDFLEVPFSLSLIAAVDCSNDIWTCRIFSLKSTIRYRGNSASTGLAMG